MRELSAYATLAMTLGLVLGQPRIGPIRVGPTGGAAAGVLVMLAVGVGRPGDLAVAARDLLRPFVGVAAIIVTAAVAQHVRILERLTYLVEPTTRGPVPRAFLAVFVLSAATSALLNNDAAVLVLTPLVATLIRRLYPLRPYLVVPFAFAVFAAAGVAPLVVSNPMNLVVATYMGIGFNEYAARMLPVTVVCWVTAYVVLRVVFRRQLDDDVPARGPEAAPPPPMTRAAKEICVVFVATLASYPVVSVFGGPVWLVAAAGVGTLVVLCWARRVATPVALARLVSWDILAFLFLVFVLVAGLKNVGIAARLAGLYGAAGGSGHGAQLAAVGVTSALGSAVLNNHPMALLNAAALSTIPGSHKVNVLAALVGGDLGPRLLPMGSLAGLLWLASLRREGVHVGLGQFVAVGAAVTLPSLALGLLTLYVQTLLT